MTKGVDPLRERYRREPGLRERKKFKAMRHIQDTALRLFDEHGFTAVTIEQVAAEAEVSASTIYRHFGTKEQLVLYDDVDPILMRRLDEELATTGDVVDALQRTIVQAVQEFAPDDDGVVRSRLRHMMNEPSVRAGLTSDLEQMDALLREILAKHTGHDANGLHLRVLVTNLLHTFMTLVTYWHETGYAEKLDDLVDEAFTIINNGLRLPES